MLKYEVIYNELRQLIQLGELAAGVRLPSIRSLSERFACNKSTVLTALKKLEHEHLTYSVPKSGYYVVDHQLPQIPSPSAMIDFATSSPAWHAFPYKDFQHCINKAIDTYQANLFQYGTPRGLPSLIAESQKLLESYQVFAQKEHVFVTSGVQQALALLSLMPFPNRRTTVLVEQPSYHLYMDFIKTHRLPVVGIQRTHEGIDLDQLERLFCSGDIKFFYTMPRFHNPLGLSYTFKQKEALVHLAHKYDVYIVEDDYLADFDLNTKRDPLYSRDLHDRVIYLKSFSKIMFPGLRIGLAVLPGALVEPFQQYRATFDIDSSMISQAALELYLKSGMFERYRAQVSETYTTRGKILQQSMNTHLHMYPYSTELGMHSHVVLPKGVNMNMLIHQLEQQHIMIDRIDRNYIDDFYRERILKLNVSNVDTAQIEKGISAIADALHDRSNYY